MAGGAATGWWPRTTGGGSLVFTVGGVVKDKARLKGLFDLFAETLNRQSPDVLP